jgi:hypothetical protein
LSVPVPPKALSGSVAIVSVVVVAAATVIAASAR